MRADQLRILATALDNGETVKAAAALADMSERQAMRLKSSGVLDDLEPATPRDVLTAIMLSVHETGAVRRQAANDLAKLSVLDSELADAGPTTITFSPFGGLDKEGARKLALLYALDLCPDCATRFNDLRKTLAPDGCKQPGKHLLTGVYSGQRRRACGCPDEDETP